MEKTTWVREKTKPLLKLERQRKPGGAAEEKVRELWAAKRACLCGF